MHPDTRLVCGLGLVIIGVVTLRISWTSLTFQANDQHEYDFHDLAFYGGKLGALKNLVRGLMGIFTGKHRPLRGPSFTLLLGFAVITAGILLINSAQS